MIASRYYYDRLGEQDKRIYKEIYNGIMHLSLMLKFLEATYPIIMWAGFIIVFCGIIHSFSRLVNTLCGMQYLLIKSVLK